MKINVKEWINSMPKQKKAFPILSFPAISLTGLSVRQLISDANAQADGLKQIADRVDSLGAVSLMDLSIEAECFGASVVFSDSEVPTVRGRIVGDMEEAEALAVPSVGSARSGLSVEAIRLACQKITDRPTFAGITGPFSLSARLMDVSEIMLDCFDQPEVVHLVLEKATQFLIEYAQAFKSVGANGIIIAEPVSGLLSPSMEAEFSAPYVKKIVDAVQDDYFAVIYHNCGDNVPKMTQSLISIGAAAYHFGNSVDLRVMLDAFPKSVVVMGNVDPAGVLRMGSVQTVREQTTRVLKECSPYENFVVSTGCDVPPLTPWSNIDAFFSAVEEFYKNERKA